MAAPVGDCCGGEVYESMPMEVSGGTMSYPVEGEVYQGGYEQPSVDSSDVAPIVVAPVDHDSMPVEQPMESTEIDSSSDVPMTSDAVEPATEEPVADEPVEAAPPVAEPKMEEPEPAAEVAPADDGGLFDAPMDEPAQTPAPASEPTDDLFGAPADEPAAMPADDPFGAPAEAAPAAEAPADDLFGAPMDDAPAADAGTDLFGDAPTEPAAEAAPMDDLFGAPADAPAADGPMDDLFGDPAGDAAPADAAPMDDLFGEPPAGGKPAEEPSLDDLFGQGSAPAADEKVTDSLDDLFGSPLDEPAVEPQSELSIEDLFGKLQSTPAATETVSVESEAVETETVELVQELPAPLQVVSNVSDLTDPLADARSRVWVDNTGSFNVEGKLIEIRDDYVRLLKSNGRTCTVPTSRLCDADAAYVASVSAKIANSRIAMLTAK